MANQRRVRLGELLEQRAKNAKSPKLRVGPAGSYFANSNDMLKVPETIEAVKQADELATRLGLHSG